jgi:hypothetical protein
MRACFQPNQNLRAKTQKISSNARSLGLLSFQDGGLLSKNEIFQQTSAASLQTPGNRCHQQTKYAKHWVVSQRLCGFQ